MGWITDFAAGVVFVALALSAAVLIALTYDATGAPAARHELYRLTARSIHRINGGPITLGQRIASGASTIVRTSMSLNPLKSANDEVAWASSVIKDTELTDDKISRRQIYDLLASTRPSSNEHLDRMLRREQQLIARVIDADALAAAENLSTLHQCFREQERTRRLAVLRNPSTYVDTAILAPLATRSLDYIGRGTAAGLLVGVLARNGSSIPDAINTVGMTSLTGGALGSVCFLALLLRLLPPAGIKEGDERPRVDRFRERHPLTTAAGFTLFCAVMTKIPTLVPILSGALGMSTPVR